MLPSQIVKGIVQIGSDRKIDSAVKQNGKSRKQIQVYRRLQHLINAASQVRDKERFSRAVTEQLAKYLTKTIDVLTSHRMS